MKIIPMLLLALISSPGVAAEAAPQATTPTVGLATKAQMATLEAMQKRLNNAGKASAQVVRKTTIGMLSQEKLASGDLILSKGRIRMDLKTGATQERQLLIVGDKKFWAVTYPSKELKGAAVQVVMGSVDAKKANQGFLALLGKGGFLKSFSVSGVALDKDGGIRYYLQPKTDWVEAKRALLALSPEVKGQRTLQEIQIWDSQDNETHFTLENLKFETKAAAASNFEFAPPANADIMSVN